MSNDIYKDQVARQLEAQQLERYQGKIGDDDLLVDGEPINYSGLPEHLQDGMRRWMEDGIRPGALVMAILGNDLLQIFKLVDLENMTIVRDVVLWLRWHAPTASYGSPEKVDNWMRRRGTK